MPKKYNTVVFILRGQPVHKAHIEIIRRASTMASKLVVILGSADQPRTYKNPFTAAEREQMIRSSVEYMIPPSCKLFIAAARDSVYNNQAWAIRIQEIVAKYSGPSDSVAIIGHEKDESSFYIRLFPQWKIEDVELIEPLNATDIRDLYFRNDANMRFLESVVPSEVFRFLRNFKDSEPFKQIVREREFIAAYKKQYESLPYPPIFVTVDACLIQSGHVLLIKRRSEPGRGLWALPGGFLNAGTDKSVQDAMIRELREETGIKVPVPVLIGSIKDAKVFDAINRSARGRTITHCFKIVLPDGELPKVKGSDDAIKAEWIPIGLIDPSTMFEDHFDLVSWSLGG